MKSMQSLSDKMKKAGTKVRHVNAKQTNLQGGAKNRNQAYTSGGAKNQGYDPETKQFTKGSTSTRSGKLAVEGSNNTKGARTWTMTEKDENGNTVRQSGRSQTATRRQREYDVKKGFNNMTETVARAMLDAGQMTQAEYNRMHGAGGGSTGSLGLATG